MATLLAEIKYRLNVSRQEYLKKLKTTMQLFLLSNECNVSHGKIRKLLSELTGGELEISDGMINSLCVDFSLKSKAEKKEIIKRLMTSPVMNADFTTANVNGKSAQVLVLASPVNGAALYIGREKKGHEGVKGTPLADYVGIVVQHDHDKTFYRYGTGHQECTQHDCRYLIGSKENEPELEWNHKMHALFQEMLHYRNGLKEDEEADAAIVEAFEKNMMKYWRKRQKNMRTARPVTITGRDIICPCVCVNIRKVSCAFCMIKGYLQIIRFVRDLPGYIKGNRNRQWFCGAKEIWNTSVMV